eukprot:XP_019920108.1 PREDICTED: tenascin [Crassostrea gigas]
MYTYYVSQVHVKIGNERTFTQSICQPSHMTYKPKDMNITCSSWNKDKYTVMDTTDCPLNSAQCERIDKYCICHCFPGYSIINGSCLKDHVPVGGFCSVDNQCTGSNNSETCDNGRCRCSDGHLLLDLECIQGNLSLNQSCTVHEQCSSSNYSRCVDEKCTCMEGYTADNLTSCIKCKLFISYYLHRQSYIMPVITNVS